jgi:hypothetical protein
MKKIVLTAPNGTRYVNPDISMLEYDILHGGQEHWEDGSGDAGIKFFDNDCLVSELILMVREPYGVFVHYTGAEDGKEYVLNSEEGGNDSITTKQGGDPWTIPIGFCVDKGTAVHAVRDFLESGKKTTSATWVEF